MDSLVLLAATRHDVIVVISANFWVSKFAYCSTTLLIVISRQIGILNRDLFDRDWGNVPTRMLAYRPEHAVPSGYLRGKTLRGLFRQVHCTIYPDMP